MIQPRKKIIASLLLALAMMVSAAPPLWWSTGNTPVIDTNAEMNNKGPANIGQAKHMAKSALDALETVLPAVSNLIESDLTTGNNPIVDFSIPDPKTPEWIEKQKAPLLNGQLKAIADPFYTRLHATKPTWLQAERVANGTNHAGSIFPWSAETTDDANKAIANIGQLKAVFSLRFETIVPGPPDADGDGLDDGWELQYFTNLTQTGSGDPDNDGLTNAQEFAMGTDPSTIGDDGDANGLPDDWELANAGIFAIYPPLFSASLDQGQTAQSTVFLSNDTNTAVDYTIAVDGKIAPIPSTDYIAEQKPFIWEEIKNTGTLLDAISNHDDASQPVDITGFTFPFEGQNFSRVYVSSNGLLTFTSAYTGYFNTALPYPNILTFPVVAALWDDLHTGYSGEVYSKQENDRLIIQYENVAKRSGSSTYTFQIVLYADGRILLRYHTLTGITNSCTVGIQGAPPSSGPTPALQIVWNQYYLANSMAIEIRPRAEFFTISPLSGTVPAHSITQVSGLFQSLTLTPGVYEAGVTFTNTGSGDFLQILPARLELINHPATVAITAPITGQSIFEGQNLDLHATASDPDIIARVEFYDGETKIGDAAADGTGYSLLYLAPPQGVRQITAKVIDIYGGITVSSPVSVTVLPPAVWLVQPASGGNLVQWNPLQLLADTANPESVAKVEFYDGSVLIGEALVQPFSFIVLNLEPGTHSFVARAIDGSGAGINSLPVSFTILADTDHDGMPNEWEISNGLIPQVDDSLDDLDGDRIPNIFEYQHGANPNDINDVPSPAFVVDAVNGVNDPNDNIESTIGAALSKAAALEPNGSYDPNPIILVRSGVYNENVVLSGLPIVLLGELGAATGPPEIRPDQNGAAVTLGSTSVVDGFIISHQSGALGSGVLVQPAPGGGSCHVRLINCIVKTNTASFGGGISVDDCELDLIHCTVIGNSASSSSPGVSLGNSILHLANSVVYGNQGDLNISSRQIEIGLGSSVTATLVAPSNIGENPQVPTPGWIYRNPGLTADGYVVDMYSSVVDSGGLISGTKVLFDIHGQHRPSGNLPDIGAYEFVPDYPPDDDAETGVNAHLIDSDGDGIPDQWELANGLDPGVPNSNPTDLQNYLDSRYSSGGLEVHTPLR